MLLQSNHAFAIYWCYPINDRVISCAVIGDGLYKVFYVSALDEMNNNDLDNNAINDKGRRGTRAPKDSEERSVPVNDSPEEADPVTQKNV
ncbi:hypothetical protein [Candidatus Albibeggiatoa sp. nov. NOAA]|uniref:hypothetical protein n=1 Tax=Candidatus Albibeggiatoa sp. nov. NOAA TaxID=3162724 RepID=UPI0032F9D2F0|nr:hypothetical protein [Thiotrichaceae bacterium]